MSDPSAPEPQPAKPAPSRLGRNLVVALLLAVVVYGVFVVLRGASEIRDRLAMYAWSTFAIACGLSFTSYVLRFLKWEYYLAMLGVRGVPKLRSFLVFLSGFVLTVTPGKVGEVFKSVVLQEVAQVPVERTAGIVVAERATDLIAVIALIAIGSISFPGGAVWAVIGAVPVVLLLVLIASTRASDALIRALPRLPGVLGRLGSRVAGKMDVAMRGLRMLTSAKHLVVPTLLSIFAWGLEGVGLWIILGGFGVTAPLPLTAFFYATATLVGALVPVPGGLGVMDKLLEEQMARLGGVPAPIATAAMLLVRFATLWFAVVVGFVALLLLRRARRARPHAPFGDTAHVHEAVDNERTTS